MFDDEYSQNDIHQMVNYKDGHLGSQAIHFAAACGKREVLEIITHDFGANVHALTNSNQSVMHCAAQRYTGVFSIFIFYNSFEVEVSQRDENGATPLHFAALSGILKNV